ncbi:protein of unknown function [Methylocaldum szegediense]|uniref:Uncharacterized protein n=1 Tax=Methylocaldum szegediense TaxID=73780 RepID=A0ABM9I966_9GAMM|nr:protein of unknown function [Methylocaldum szegediense]
MGVSGFNPLPVIKPGVTCCAALEMIAMRGFNPLPVIKPGVTVPRGPYHGLYLVSIHSRLLSRELQLAQAQAEYDTAVSIHSRLLSRELRIVSSDLPFILRFQSTPGY